MKLLLKISYNGAAYCGFQAQKNGVAVQNVMTAASEKVFGFPCNVTGCSRTDSGVHALGFCCTVEPRGEHGGAWCAIPTARVHRAYASVLPGDISVIAAAEVPDDFHARYSVTGKKYIYRIWDEKWDNPFEKGRSYRCIPRIDEGRAEQMKKASKCFVGNNDFSAFMAKGSKITDAHRTVYSAEIYRESGGALVFSVSADGFLYNMVRIMAGTLVDVAAGRLESGDIEKIISSRDRKNAGFTAPPWGLYLDEVYYNTDINWECE